MAVLFALTGPIAAGKNAASDILARHGFACIDADALVHVIIEEKKEEILSAFLPLAREGGVELLREGKIDRRALGSVLFKNPQALAAQEAIVHPEVSRKTGEFIAANGDKPVVINATVLYKTPDLLGRCCCVLFVDAPKITRFFRIRRRNGLPARQILERIRSQNAIFSQYMKSHADIYRVWNSGSLSALEKKIGIFLAGCEEKGYLQWKKSGFYG
ncbi:MAG: dephospho-CoA kinase [Spirochaetaceae bacterium]|jgi:dephospho-CoA kinase|nr:dephospho-CoA kinase [Spirochaetaceae bacterium]